MGGARKAFLELAGEPLLVHALRPFLADDRVVAVVVALDAHDVADPPEWLGRVDARLRIIQGGETRTDSVRNALGALPEDLDVIAVHDAARPLVTRDVVEMCIDAAARGEGAVAGCPAVDTMKTVDESRHVRGTPERAFLWHAHTPQVFPADVLRRAYASAGSDATDDAGLVEATGAAIRMVDEGAGNLKITRPEDLPLAEAILRMRAGGRT